MIDLIYENDVGNFSVYIYTKDTHTYTHNIYIYILKCSVDIYCVEIISNMYGYFYYIFLTLKCDIFNLLCRNHQQYVWLFF